MPHLYQSITDGGIAVRMELHGVSYDVRHFVVSSVIHTLHGVQDAALHGFQTILDMRYGTIQYRV